jgi:undecaprenyl pyrophosphate phosphatase UppP
MNGFKTNLPREIQVLAAGDAIALLLWVVAGLASHQMWGSWLFNLLRVAAPFLIGWFAVAPFTGAYRLPRPDERGQFMRRSALTWLIATAVGLALRSTIFRSTFFLTFALITLLITGIFVLGWRATFAWLIYPSLQSRNASRPG